MHARTHTCKRAHRKIVAYFADARKVSTQAGYQMVAMPTVNLQYYKQLYTHSRAYISFVSRNVGDISNPINYTYIRHQGRRIRYVHVSVRPSVSCNIVS